MATIPARAVALTLAVFVSPMFAASAPPSQTVVHPRPTEAHLRNPGMGFIFYSSIGRETVPDEADVLYACVPVWGQVEKTKGRYDWDIPPIKGVEDLARRHGLRWCLRVMPSFQGHKFPMGWGAKDWEALRRARPDLVRKATLRVGFRIVVTEARWPSSLEPGQELTVATTWKNTAVACSPYRYVPALYLVEPQSGRMVARDTDSQTDVRTWQDGVEQRLNFKLRLQAQVPIGRYNLAVAMENEASRPAIALGVEGDDGQKRYVLGQVEVVAPAASEPTGRRVSVR